MTTVAVEPAISNRAGQEQQHEVTYLDGTTEIIKCSVVGVNAGGVLVFSDQVGLVAAIPAGAVRKAIRRVRPLQTR